MYAILKTLFWVFVLVLALSFFGISIKSIIESPAGQANFAYLFNLFHQAWQAFVHFAQTKI